MPNHKNKSKRTSSHFPHKFTNVKSVREEDRRRIGSTNKSTIIKGAIDINSQREVDRFINTKEDRHKLRERKSTRTIFYNKKCLRSTQIEMTYQREKFTASVSTQVLSEKSQVQFHQFADITEN